jgi:5'-3' exonuclease
MATLRGDTSDGLPGVPGVGEKTAATLINRYGDLGSLRRALADGDPQIKGAQRQRLEAASSYLDVAPLVVQVALDVPIPAFDASLPRAVGDLTLLSSLASGYGLTNPLNRVLNALGLGDDS